MNLYIWFVAVAHVLFVQHAGAYNILLTLFGISGSQNGFIYKLGELLADHGHDVTILRTDFIPGIPVPKVKKIKREIISMPIKDKATQDTFAEMIGKVDFNNTGFRLEDIKKLGNVKTIFGIFGALCNGLLDNDAIMAELRSKKYDVIGIHMADACGIGLAHVLNIKATVLISTAFSVDFLSWYSGAPVPTAYVPSAIVPFGDRMTLAQRFQNTLSWMAVNGLFSRIVLPYMNKCFIERYGPDFPHLRSLIAETQLYFINSDTLLDYPKPTMPNMVNIGGFMMENKGSHALTEEWEAIASSPAAKKHGFIIFSLGSVVNTKYMPFEIKMRFFNAFRRLPQQIIWRCVGELPPFEGTNVHITNWMPQPDLLGHKNIVAFITHGGFNSVMESSVAGVPLVMIPCFADQLGNYQRVKRIGFGVHLDKNNLTEENIYNTVKTVIADKTYSRNAKRLARMFEMKPISNRQQAVKWIEFLAEFQTLDNLQAGSKYLHLYQYFLLDILFIGTAVMAVVMYCCCRCCRFCCSRLCGKKEVKPKHD